MLASLAVTPVASHTDSRCWAVKEQEEMLKDITMLPLHLEDAAILAFPPGRL
jgi:hypothetical protein